MKTTIIVQDKEHLKLLIQQEITLHGNHCDLNHIDTSKITDMSFMFFQSEYDGDISQWNVSNVKDMNYIFHNSNSSKPWWAIEDNEQRNIAINNYQLMRQLEEKLISKEKINQDKKSKI